MLERGRHRLYRRETQLFAERHLPILQAWVDGYKTVDEMASVIGKNTETVRKLRTEITSVLTEGIGKDPIAKAVTFALIHLTESLNFEVIDAIRPKRQFTEREIAVIPLIVEGFNNGQIADALSLTRWEVRRSKNAILENLGVDSIYTVIAWGFRSVMRRRES
ncbi:hypothetical protein A2696_04155 [Candidatus Curtissbacteria bacterium RIFCSPHIGHO2_01_FULL_41_13]|uniref:HTH luxR-type domain-containing protein n=1 Tax=Candidatus Curtissbacteria bacterium RIFCSPHIGHO2_01_FULL_41_13 TaxID=1797745 RepID=A0A1F5FZ68_9BACT|nr:MAG: hypothetical protein A2696_04155 [Candidatus Curtissbacteria bacterium RIFCSPHIGHO2_01_FULL_41_13]